MKRTMFFLSLALIIGVMVSSACTGQERNSYNQTPDTMLVIPTKAAVETSSTSPPSRPPSPAPNTPEARFDEMDEPALDLNEANVIGVAINRDPSGAYTFSVTLLHNDTGWEHYADWWRVRTRNGEELARRVLTHPHVEEQPFTRSMSGITVPEEVERVVVEGHDSLHGYGGQTFTVDLESGETAVTDSFRGR